MPFVCKYFTDFVLVNIILILARLFGETLLPSYLLKRCTLLTFTPIYYFTAQHLSKTSLDVTKRWVNEAQEAVNSDNVMVQYHALGLLYHIRKRDKLAVNKLVQKFTRGQLKSPYGMCLLVSAAICLTEYALVTV